MNHNRIATYAAALAFIAASGDFAQAAEESASRAPSRQSLVPTDAEREARLGWWRDSRFGMFVHWGVYSGLSGTWKGKKYGGYAEHIQRMAKIPIPVYHKEVAGNFNPVNFDADTWMRAAKQAGMGYFIITAKHHDGFAMYDSKVSPATITKMTPFKRDPMKELAAAARKHGVKFGFYYSHAFDWGEENGPGNDWEFENPGGDRLLHGANWWEKYPEFLPKVRKYVDEKSIPQLQELIANYDPDIIWFDTPHKLSPEENQRILAAVRKAKPSLVINGRLISGLGDYQSTCDRPAEFPPQKGDWEGVPTTNESYGYNENDKSHKSSAHFIQLIAKAAARGGNTLLNIGPRGDGAFDPTDVAILEGVGKWWAVNADSIRGTIRTPLAVQAWGQSTRKGNKLYLHVFDWPANGKLIVGGLKTNATRASLLANPVSSLECIRMGPDLMISVPKKAPDETDSVVVLEFDSEPAGEPLRLLSKSVLSNDLHVYDSQLVGKLRFGPGKKTDDVVLDWNDENEFVQWTVRIHDKASFDIEIQYDAPAATGGGRTVDGDAGKESVARLGGSSGTYIVSIGDQKFTKKVVTGIGRLEALGKVTLEPGNYQINLKAKEISGEELFRLRRLTLTPAGNP